MTEERKIQIPITGDTSGIKQSFQEVKAAGRELGQSLQQSAQQATQGIQGLGAATQALTRDQSRFADMVRRNAVLATEGKAAYLEQRAAILGVSEQVAPFIAKLREAEASQNSVGTSAKAMSAALRGVPAQFTDIVTSISSGQRPLQVLIQQGGQLKDMFGGIGPAARALGGYVAGLVNPFTLGAAAIAALAVAAHQGGEELRGFQNAVTLNGNAVGLSVSRFGQLRDSLQGIAGTKGKAAEALTEIARNGQIASTNVQSLAEAAILMEKATGQAVGKTVEQFAQLAKSPTDAAVKLNEQFNFLTTSIYRQIDALEDKGQKDKAAAVAEQAFADALKARAQTVVDNAGYMEKAWRGITGAAKAAWDAMLGAGRELTPAQQLADAAARVARIQSQISGVGTFAETGGGAAVGGASAGRRAALERDLELAKQAQREAQRRVEIEASNAFVQAENTRLQALGVEFLKQGDQYLTRQQQREKELTKARTEGQQLVRAGLITEKELTDRLVAIRQKYNETSGESGIAQQRAARRIAEEENRRLQAGIDGLDFSSPTKLTEAEKRVVQIQEELKGSLMGVARANKEKELAAAQAAVQDEKSTQLLQQQYEATKKAREEITKQADAVGQQADAIARQADGQEAANATFGKSKTAIEETVLAQLKLQAAEAEASDTFDPRYVAGLNAKVEAQKRYVDALQQAEFLQKSRQLDQATRASQEETQTLQLEVSLLGRSREEREKIIAQRRVAVQLAKELSEIDQLNTTDDKKEELRVKARTKAQIDAANAGTKATLEEWQRTADSINQSLTDALLRGFESGKDFARNFRDTLKNMFSTLVLKPIIQGVMAPVSGALAGFGQSIGGMFGNSMGGLGNLGSLVGLGGMFAGGSSLANTAGTAFANATGTGLDGLLATNGAFGTAAGGSGAAAGAAGAFSSIPVAGWIAAAALLDFQSAKKSGLPWWSTIVLPGSGFAARILGVQPPGGPKTESGFGIGVPMLGDPTSSKEIADAIAAQYRAIAGDRAAKDFQLGVFTSADPQGTALTQLGVNARLNGADIYSRAARLGGIENVGRSAEDLQAALAEETKRVVLAALQATGLPDQVGEYLRQLGDIDKLSGGALDKALVRMQVIMNQRQALDQQEFDLTHTEQERLTAARKREREALDETNRALYDHVAALADLRAAEAKARDDLLNAFQRESDNLRSVVERNQGFAQQLREFRDGLAGSGPLSLAQRRALTASKFEGALASAIAGNEQALQGGLATASNDFLQAVKASARTPAELAAALAKVQAGLTTAAAAADGRASAAQQQLDAMTQQLTALGVINASVLSVGDALAAFLNAQTAIQQEQLKYTAQIASEQASADQAARDAAAAAAAAVVVTTVDNASTAYQVFVDYSRGLPGIGPEGAATGGLRPSGPLMVGELGPEIVDFDTPGRVYTNEQTRGMFASNAELLPAVRELCRAFAASDENRRREAMAVLQQITTVASKLKKFDNEGLPPERVTP